MCVTVIYKFGNYYVALEVHESTILVMNLIEFVSLARKKLEIL